MAPERDIERDRNDPIARSEPAIDDPATAIVALHFAGYRLLTHRQALVVDGVETPLSTKLYHLLLTFARRPGEVLDKETLVSAAWPGQVVTDAALAKQIQRLRQLLNDAERPQPLLETHRGIGYRLTCAVEAECSRPSVRTSPAATSVTPSHRRRYAPLAAAAVVGAVLLAVLYAFLSGTSAPPGRSVAVLPVADAGSALSEGAAEYLSMLLGPAAAVAPALALDESPDRATELGGIELAKHAPGPVLALHVTREGNAGYRLRVSLRGTGQPRSTTLSDDSAQALLERGAQWVRENVAGLDPATPTAGTSFAVASYFEGLAVAGTTCERSAEFFRAALSADKTFHRARLRLGRCARQRGEAHEAAAAATTLLAHASDKDTDLALDAHLLAARAFVDLGDHEAARPHLDAARALSGPDAPPLRRLSGLAGLALGARIDGDPAGARAYNEERLSLAEQHFPLAGYRAAIHLELARDLLDEGDHAALQDHARKARALAEESGNRDLLMRSYRYLASSYFRNDELDAAVQLALAARPLLDTVDVADDKAFFLQFATLALNLRGRFAAARDYTAALREVSKSSANPLLGAIADLTVMHRLYVQGRFEESRTFAASTRARLESSRGAHAAIPLALSFEAIAAARGASVAEAAELARELETRFAGLEALEASLERTWGHILARQGQHAAGLARLRKAESLYRETGMRSVGNYVGYEIVELRLDAEAAPPWDDIERLGDGFSYQLATLRARAHARDGNFVAATSALEEARLRGNELWSPADQLLLERFRSGLVMADNRQDSGHGNRSAGMN